MPELPEVETIARGLAQRVVGDVIESVWIGEKPQPLKSSAQEIAGALEGAKIVAVERVGKHIVVELSKPDQNGHVPNQWIVHLGMTGSLLIVPADAAIAKHTHLIARLQSGRELRFVDPRRFGRLAVRQTVADNAWAGGQEPLQISADDLSALFRGRNTLIKSALLNQKLLRGVGNIYADEALHRAGIRPRRRAASLTRAELKLLHRHLQAVLRQAIAAGGSSISDYVDVDGESGNFQFRHRVYGREGMPCRKCKCAIKRVVIAGRSAHYCPHCQK
jgi:formamidopyrimidine-DNA glycosylase